MAFDAFLKIDGIDGESTTKGFEKWIDLISFNWSAVATAQGNGHAAGRVTPQGFSFMKVTDSASPTIFAKMAQGSHFDKVSLACRLTSTDAAGAASDAFLKIDLMNVLVSGYHEGGNVTTDTRPMESVSLVFTKIEFQAAAISPDGSLGQATSGGFDFSGNRTD
jgi:type VI secretion system secreted protein Hcp